MTVSVLFVCLGNICRSPTAEGVFRHLAEAAGADVICDSAGTSNWHVGGPPDRRAVAEARGRGIDLSGLRARQVGTADFDRFDLIYGMDRANIAKLEALRPAGNATPVALFLGEAPGIGRAEVPDPYYEDNFPEVFDMLEAASRGLLARL
ncbi:low molecular weight protein-tyrosine-phosphatase [Dinoroseobacter shibae]|jgi:protein-tyrosine phosphatase|nr:low molecular weight protein-tyrosine-phosphatase [Dinoroseobacter shibae]URF45777.1 low molecular weight phosphotyrosine protein phosphatase [Dinoroseobacter shibae]URF50083.1 low molecular weight phosphotyrosine protein phosphatase [Dinoroseobacter shibae]